MIQSLPPPPPPPPTDTTALTTSAPTTTTPAADDEALLTAEEDRETGVVSWRVWRAYLDAMGRPATAAYVAFFALTQALQCLNDWWVAQWSADAYHTSPWVYLGVYAGCGGCSAVLIAVRSVAAAVINRGASTALHDAAMAAVFRCAVAFSTSRRSAASSTASRRTCKSSTRRSRW